MGEIKYARLGHSGIEMSRVCLGGMSFDERIPGGHQWTLGLELTPDEIAYLKEPYRAHELVGPLARPGEKPLAATVDPNKK